MTDVLMAGEDTGGSGVACRSRGRDPEAQPIGSSQWIRSSMAERMAFATAGISRSI